MNRTVTKLLLLAVRKLPHSDPALLVRPFEVLRKVKDKLSTITMEILDTCTQSTRDAIQAPIEVFFFYLLDSIAAAEQAIARAKIQKKSLDSGNGLASLQQRAVDFNKNTEELLRILQHIVVSITTPHPLPVSDLKPTLSSSSSSSETDQQQVGLFNRLDVLTRTLSTLHDATK